MSDAIEAIRSDDVDAAIPYFERLTHERPTYHIGWLRLGYARREKAVRMAQSDPTEAVRLLTLSIADLSKAVGHIDPKYQAQALYERSKSAYHLARLFPEAVQEGGDYSKKCRGCLLEVQREKVRDLVGTHPSTAPRWRKDTNLLARPAGRPGLKRSTVDCGFQETLPPIW